MGDARPPRVWWKKPWRRLDPTTNSSSAVPSSGWTMSKRFCWRRVPRRLSAKFLDRSCRPDAPSSRPRKSLSLAQVVELVLVHMEENDPEKQYLKREDHRVYPIYTT